MLCQLGIGFGLKTSKFPGEQDERFLVVGPSKPFVTFRRCRNLMASETGVLDEGQGCTRDRGQRRPWNICDAGVSRCRCNRRWHIEKDTAV
jgi:hypothetical protein